MYNEDFLQQQSIKRGWYKYYSLKKVGIGTHPTDGMIDFINYESGKKVDNMPIYAILYYERELSESELNNYDMVKDDYWRVYND